MTFFDLFVCLLGVEFFGFIWFFVVVWLVWVVLFFNFVLKERLGKWL